MIPVMWIIVAIIVGKDGNVVNTMSPSWPTQEECEKVRANGDSFIKSKGFKVESKCVMFGGVES